MSLQPQKLREIVFELLYSYDFAQTTADDMAPFIMKHHTVTKKNFYEAEAQKKQILEKLPLLDQVIAQASEEYEFSRIPRVEKNILRLALFELSYKKEEVPPLVVIAEAIRLARKFSTPEGATFINALLDKIYKGSLA